MGRKVQLLQPKGGRELSPKGRIKLFRRSKPLTSEKAQGISTEFMGGYVTAVVGKQPVNFAVASNKSETDDFGTLFRHHYKKFGEGTKLESNRRGHHIVLIIERSLVLNAIGGAP